MLMPVAAVFVVAFAVLLIATSPKVQRILRVWRKRQRTGKGRR
jgi:hypothetical protein